MKSRAKFLDYAYEEVLDIKTRELIRVGCAVAVGCPD
jgi:alkylhydroperoxidase/carboxymuconolactone decarboxylase family protein YurZ